MELKPCPFCGGKIDRIVGFTGLNFFRCPQCWATVSFDDDYYNEHKNEAYELWNRRADNA